MNMAEVRLFEPYFSILKAKAIRNFLLRSCHYHRVLLNHTFDQCPINPPDDIRERSDPNSLATYPSTHKSKKMASKRIWKVHFSIYVVQYNPSTSYRYKLPS